jgi:formylglycine-generating enzyme required for sulfatase activity
LSLLFISVLQAQEREIAVTLPGGIPLHMVWIEPGSYTMGTTQRQTKQMEELQQQRGTNLINNYVAEIPAHAVKLSQGFYLGQYEITRAQWSQVMDTLPWADASDSTIVEPHFPAVQITWYGAGQFAERLNQWAGADLFRLPTEAEWEYAARAGSNGLWHVGDDVVLAENFGWYFTILSRLNHPFVPRQVGTRWPNGWGLYDMQGNVHEWVQDSFQTHYYQSQAADVINPLGPTESSIGVLRGGSAESNEFQVRPAYRMSQTKNTRDGRIGFRIAMENPVDLRTDLEFHASPSGLALEQTDYKDTVAVAWTKTVIGDGETGFAWDGDVALSARIENPWDVAVSREGEVYFADSNAHRVRQIDAGGILRTLAGGGTEEDGELAAEARLISPRGLYVEADGSFYVSSGVQEGGGHRVQWVDSQGVITTVAGSGEAGFTGDGTRPYLPVLTDLGACPKIRRAISISRIRSTTVSV